MTRRRRDDELPPAARRGLIVMVLAAHLAAIYGLLQIGAVREAVREAVPIFAGLIRPAAPPVEPPAPPPPPAPVVKRVVPPPIIAAAPAPAPAPAEFVVPPAPPEAVVAVEAPPAPAAPPAPPPLPAPQPRTVDVSAVGYLEPPRVSYPPLSRRLGEEGRALLRVLVDPSGRPTEVIVSTSSGFSRLDDAATSAARRTRFRPYTENGVARTVWVLMPFVFTLKESP
jgi:protein TonB